MGAGVRLWLALAILLASAGASQAGDQAERLAAELRTHGFTDVQVTRTLLGRTRIVADSKRGQREIVLDPRTGQILRDLFVATGNDEAQGGDGPAQGAGPDNHDGDGGDDHDGNDGGHGDGGHGDD